MGQPASEIKLFLYILVLLMVLLGTTGLMNYIYLKRIDDRYTVLVGRANNNQNAMLRISINSSKQARCLHQILTDTNSSHYKALVEDMHQSSLENDSLLEALAKGNHEWPGADSIILITREAREDFIAIRDSIVTMVLTGNRSEALTLRDSEFLKKLDHYRQHQMDLALHLGSSANKISKEVTNYTNHIRRVTLAIAFVPIVILGLIILFLGYFVRSTIKEVQGGR
ncbi:MAG: MCP four helix bundle domain-containing protein [Chitinophagales bacterium]